jgi:hypothetical protein
MAQAVSLTTPVVSKNRLFHLHPNEQLQVMLHPDTLKKNKIISIDLPQNIRATFENTKLFFRSENNFSWFGKPTNGATDDFSLFTTKNGATYGIIVLENIKYVLQINPDGSYTIFKQDRKKINFNDFLKLPPKKANAHHPQKIITKDSLNETVQNSIQMSSRLRAAKSTIDVLVLYTQAYANHYGSSLDATIQLSIDYANTALGNSDVLLNYRLAHQHLFENINSNESVAISDALKRISAIDPSTGESLSIDSNADVREIRAQYSADLTALFRLNTTGGTVGLGWVASSNTKSDMRHSSFNVSEFSDETFAHESGHNLGCGHSRDIDNCGGALFNYACGFDNGSFGTVMSYNSTLIPYFSTPNKTHNGTTIGAADTDCSRAFNNTRVSLASASDISEPNESSDNYNNGSINGNIDTQNDRDLYQVNLGGETTFSHSGGYYINLYNENGFLLNSFSSKSIQILKNGLYNIIISNSNDSGDNYYVGTGSYTTNIITNYVVPPVTKNNITPIIMYLLN